MSNVEATFPKRLEEARLALGISQKSPGMAIQIDEFVASARINQYERGVHAPSYDTAQRLAKALRVPTAYLHADNDADAELLLRFHALPRRNRQALPARLMHPER